MTTTAIEITIIDSITIANLITTTVLTTTENVTPTTDVSSIITTTEAKSVHITTSIITERATKRWKDRVYSSISINCINYFFIKYLKIFVTNYIFSLKD